MNQSLIKYASLLLVVAILAVITVMLVFEVREKKIAIQQQADVKQSSQSVVSEQSVENSQIENKSQEQPSNDITQDNTEILGTIVQVDVFDDNENLLLTVDADVVDQSKSDSQVLDESGDSELPMISKRFTVLVEKNVLITGGTLDDLSEEDDVQITSLENVYTTDKLTATNIEVL